MLWLDITDPKYALFFSSFLRELCALDSVLITTRESEDYSECARILRRVESCLSPTLPPGRLCVRVLGGYGGANRLQKYRARLAREEDFLTLFSELGLPRVFLSGASVEGAHCAFGLGIPIVHFSDTPLAGSRFSPQNLTALARLSLPLSKLLFHPFLIPSSVYERLGLAARDICRYDFIDVALWLDSPLDFPLASALDSHKPPVEALGEPRLDSLGLDSRALDSRQGESKGRESPLSSPPSVPLIIAREEEYKAHYVRRQLPLWRESVQALAKEAVRICIIPRYGRKELEEAFRAYENVTIAREILTPSELYAQASLLLGGGGTMNLEACFLGIPTISTRSLLLYHDRYLMRQGLMRHARTVEEVLAAFSHYRELGFPRADRQSCRRAFIKPSGSSEDLRKGLARIIHTVAERFY